MTNPAKVSAKRKMRTVKTALIAIGSAMLLTATAGCYSQRGTDTLAGAALGAGGGALIGGAEGSPGTGAVLGGLGGGLVGYVVGTEMQDREYGSHGRFY